MKNVFLRLFTLVLTLGMILGVLSGFVIIDDLDGKKDFQITTKIMD